MQAKLTLVLNNLPFESLEIDIPDYPRERFESKVELRQDYVKRKVSKMRGMFESEIIKTGNNETYYLTIESGVNKIIETV